MKYFFVLLLCLSFLTSTIVHAQSTTEASSLNMQEGTGFRGDYYNGTNFQELAHSRIDREINFSYIKQSPAPGVRGEYYSIRWTGNLYAPVTGIYKLNVRVDDGVRVWLNGVKILDQWKLQETTGYSGQLHLEGGEFYSLKIEYYNGPVHGVMQLNWEMPEEEISTFFGLYTYKVKKPREPIPGKYLYREIPPHMLAKKPESLPKYIANPAADPEPSTQPHPEKMVAKPAPVQNQPVQVVAKTVNTVPENEEPTSETIKVALQPSKENIYENLKPGEEILLSNVLFEQGKHVLLDGSYPELDKLVRTLKKQPELKIMIEGFTDNVGNPKLNQSLSFYRAKVVAKYLIDHEVEPSRLEVKGYGSSRPIADNSTEEGRAKNRRVQFVVR